MFVPINLSVDLCDRVNEYMENSTDYADEAEVHSTLLEMGLDEAQANEVIVYWPEYKLNIIFELYSAGAPVDEPELERRAALTDLQRRKFGIADEPSASIGV